MHKSPALAVDGMVVYEDKIVLVKRKDPPFQGKYALPGGFVEVGETVETAVVREVEEETGLRTSVKRLVGVYSDSDRDPRGHTVSVVFELEVISGGLKGGDDAISAEVFDIDALPEMAFDHAVIIKDFLQLTG
jgi:8-oxo-dGTP diphosphatase